MDNSSPTPNTNTSPSEPQVYCVIRRAWVAALPEEVIRQRLIKHMVEDLGFPISLIAIEQSLKQFPHLSIQDKQHVPNRRADIVCYAKGPTGKESQGQLYPLLIVECKAVKLSDKVITQVLGYNHYVRASFIAIANQHEIKVGWFDSKLGKMAFVDYLPRYHDLILSIYPESSKIINNEVSDKT